MITTLKAWQQFKLNEKQYNVLHGTNNLNFIKFKLNYNISNYVYGTEVTDNGLGVFFTDNKIMAGWFAGITEFDMNINKYKNTNNNGKIIKAKIKLNNPYIIDKNNLNYNEDNDSIQIYFNEIENAGNVKKYKDKLLQNGYDGIILKNCTTNYYKDGEYIVYVVFDIKQILSNESFNKMIESIEDDSDALLMISDIEPNKEPKIVSSDDYELISIIDVIQDPKDIEKYETLTNGLDLNTQYKDLKVGQSLYLTALLKPKSVSVINAAGTMGIIKVSIQNIYYGLQKLDQLRKQGKI
jgi:hypothetical protein